MKIDWSLIKDIAIPVVAVFVGIVLNRILERRPRLIAYIGHVSNFNITGTNPFNVYTHSVVVSNTGKKPATNVRIGHFTFPPNFNIFPSIQHRVNTLPNGSNEIVIPTIVPKEQLTISYLYTTPLNVNQINSYFKSDEGFAKVLNVIPTPLYPKWFLNVLRFLTFVGLVMVIYILIEVGIWVYALVQAVP